MSVIDKIRHYQRSIDKSNVGEERILYCIKKLYNLPVTVQHLQETGVGRTVNNLRKYDGSIGNAAKALVAKWKEMVVGEETTDEEDEACVPDVPESYNDYSPLSPTPNPVKVIDVSMMAVPAPKHEYEAGTSGSSNTDSSLKDRNKEESARSSDSRSLKSESQKHNKHEKSKHSSRSEMKNDKKSSSKDSRSSKSTSKKDEEGELKDSDLNKSVSSKKNSDKLPSTTKSSEELQSDKHDHRKRKLDNYAEDKKNNKKRKNSQESDEDNEQHSSDSEKNNSKITYTEVQPRSSKENSESRNKLLEPVYSPKDEDKSEKKSSHDKSKSNSSKSRNDESSSSVKDNEDRHRHRHKHKSDKDNERRTEKKKDSVQHSDKDSSRSKSHSSSSSKHDSDNKDKSKKREHSKEKNKKEPDTKTNKKEVKDKKVKTEINGDEGIDCNSGASFAEALGMCTMMPSRKRNNSPTLHTVKIKMEPNTSSQSSNKKMVSVKVEPTDNNSSNPLPLLSPNVKLEPLNVDLASTLPEISPNYKPLPYINHVQRRQEDKALTDVIYAKNQRTKVYSGNKSGYTSVPSLYELCIRVLIENIDALEFTGGVPYDIIKPVLERATADQLFMLEHYNPYLIEDTDSLWQFHCRREFRTKEREEMESWREMYMRCLDEREAKLKTLTANIKQSIDKSLPVRSAKLAYVDNVVKPPRNVLKKQAKYGTASSSSASDLKKKLIVSSSPTAATNISVPPPPMPRMRTSASSVVKKTKAPLMAKALQLIKGRYKR